MGTVKQWSLCLHFVYFVRRQGISSKYKIGYDKGYTEKKGE